MASDRSNGHSEINAVILDYGEVLCIRPADEEFDRMAEIFGVSRESFITLWERSRALVDRGDLTPEQYWAKFAEDTQTSTTPDQVETLCRWDIEMWTNPNPIMIDWLEKLNGAGIRIALLSNMPSDLAAHVQQIFGWMNHFHFKTFSALVGMLKPEAAIYEYTLRGLGARSSEALFVDDRPPNIQAARALGMHAIQFQSTAQLRTELEAIGFPVLPEIRA